MRSWPQIPARRRWRNFLLSGFALVAVMEATLFTLVGCKVMIPAELRRIQARLEKRAEKFERENPTAFHTYKSGTRTMRFVETGARDAKPLVIFIHGSPGDWRGWVEFLTDPDLTARPHLIAVDRPGFGGSGAGRAERSLTQQCRDIAPLLDRASPGQRVVLVGHSFGGPVACRLAIVHPHQVTDLIVLAGSIDPNQEKTKWYQYPAEWAIIRWMVPNELVTANREIRALKAGLTEMLPLWPNIHQRVTVIQGEADTLVPPANADFAQRTMTNAEPLDIIRIPRMNHFLPWKHFDLIKDAILKHIGLPSSDQHPPP